MIPPNIQREHILKAIEQIARKGIPAKRRSKHLFLIHGGEEYPCGYVISLANRFANGQELPSRTFSTGQETNRVLNHAGLTVVARAFPWEVRFMPEGVTATKRMDNSTFLHGDSAVPQAAKGAFLWGKLEGGKKLPLVLEHEGREYHAYLLADQKDATRLRLLWDSSLAKLISAKFPECMRMAEQDTLPEETPSMVFQRLSPAHRYRLEFECSGVLLPVSLASIPEEVTSPQTLVEGATRQITVNAHERSSVARSECIGHHGHACTVCGLVLSDIYGEIGDGYIHVHHLRQLSDIGESYHVDPHEDMCPVCPNCHAMIHRRKPPFTVGEMKELMCSRKGSLS